MQSWWMQMTDSGTTLELRDSPVPAAGPGQLLVRLHAAALNRGEFLLGHGLHGQPGSWKAIGGEGAGEVATVGAGVAGFRAGDPVMGRCAGAFSEYALMEASEAMAVPAIASLASISAYSENAAAQRPMTRSPAPKPAIPAPTAATSPAPSLPIAFQLPG